LWPCARPPWSCRAPGGRCWCLRTASSRWNVVTDSHWKLQNTDCATLACVTQRATGACVEAGPPLQPVLLVMKLLPWLCPATGASTRCWSCAISSQRRGRRPNCWRTRRCSRSRYVQDMVLCAALHGM
jgi:hypothetical protein